MKSVMASIFQSNIFIHPFCFSSVYDNQSDLGFISRKVLHSKVNFDGKFVFMPFTLFWCRGKINYAKDLSNQGSQKAKAIHLSKIHGNNEATFTPKTSSRCVDEVMTWLLRCTFCRMVGWHIQSPILMTCAVTSNTISSLQWRHNEHDGVSNHQPHDCLLKRLFRRRSKKTSKLRVTDLCVGNSPVTGEFSAQRASNAENVSIWWRHHDQFQ